MHYTGCKNRTLLYRLFPEMLPLALLESFAFLSLDMIERARGSLLSTIRNLRVLSYIIDINANHNWEGVKL